MTRTSAMILRLAQLRNKIAELTAKEKQLCDQLKDGMVEKGIEDYHPSDLALHLYKTEFDRPAEGFFDAMLEKAYTTLYGMDWEKRLSADKEAYPRTHVVRLEIKAGSRNYQLPPPVEEEEPVAA